ncbi:hypothetical protein Nepgr_016376 [Nepenthes gracilis]|uniref:Uncharacterized protein n=1 Tax=Nepenthes gracilis TaxID=150966 RepID=A0AAD3XSF8_NEPGR|nr:hypothetical protein Nepgr_016376 [Nepenthes gracilis]
MMESKSSSHMDKDAGLQPPATINSPTVKALVSNCILTAPGAGIKLGAEDSTGVALYMTNRFSAHKNPAKGVHRKDPIEHINEGCLDPVEYPGVKGVLVESCFQKTPFGVLRVCDGKTPKALAIARSMEEQVIHCKVTSGGLVVVLPFSFVYKDNEEILRRRLWNWLLELPLSLQAAP